MWILTPEAGPRWVMTCLDGTGKGRIRSDMPVSGRFPVIGARAGGLRTTPQPQIVRRAAWTVSFWPHGRSGVQRAPASRPPRSCTAQNRLDLAPRPMSVEPNPADSAAGVGSDDEHGRCGGWRPSPIRRLLGPLCRARPSRQNLRLWRLWPIAVELLRTITAQGIAGICVSECVQATHEACASARARCLISAVSSSLRFSRAWRQRDRHERARPR
jgi:hypothetical protein